MLVCSFHPSFGRFPGRSPNADAPRNRWYNTTYVMFATSTLLLPMSKLGPCPETVPLQRSVEMGVEILEAMDESIVARKSVEIIKHYLREFRSLPSSTSSLSHLHQQHLHQHQLNQQSLASSTSSHDGGGSGGGGGGSGNGGSGGEYADTSPSGTGFDIPVSFSLVSQPCTWNRPEAFLSWIHANSYGV